MRRGSLRACALIGSILVVACNQNPNGFVPFADTEATGSSGGGMTDTTGNGDTAADGSSTGTGGTLYCRDNDGDGFGNPGDCVHADTAPDGFVPDDTDCYDKSEKIFPGAAPNDDPQACLADLDDDDWGDGFHALAGVDYGTDCDDKHALTFPGAAPNDDRKACLRDDDDDDFGDDTPPTNVDVGTDCDDSDAATFPGAAPLDNQSLCLTDADGDGWGDPNGPIPGSDCDDNEPGTFPGAAPNDDPDACMQDDDDDDFGAVAVGSQVVAGTDCDDSESGTFPGAAPNDDPDACLADADDDDWGDVAPPAFVNAGTDCDDSDGDVMPQAAENEPCLCAADVDDDGWGDSMPASALADPGHDCDDSDGAGVAACGQICDDVDGDGFSGSTGCIPNESPVPMGKAIPACDCDDGQGETFPGAAPNDSMALCMQDLDGDDFGELWITGGTIVPGTDCVDDPAFAWPDLACAPSCTGYWGAIDPLLLAGRVHVGAAESELSSKCRMDYDGDGFGYGQTPAMPPGYPDPTFWVEAGSDSDDLDPMVN